METFEEAKVKMKAAKACKDEFEIVDQLDSWQEFFVHENAPYWCWWYAQKVVGGRFEPGEAAIAKNAYYSYYYARDVVESRWEPGEKAISKNARFSQLYQEFIREAT